MTRRLLASVGGFLVSGVAALAVLSGCAGRGPDGSAPGGGQAQGTVAPAQAAATATAPLTPIATPPPGSLTPPPSPTRDPRTPVITPWPITPTATATMRVVTLAPTHTPGPTPTNPPGEEAALHQAFAAALQDRLARGYLKSDPTSRIAVSFVHIQGEWAVVDLYRQYLSGTPVPAGGWIALARKVNGQWQVAFHGEPNYRIWLDSLPDSLMTPQDRQFFSIVEQASWTSEAKQGTESTCR